MKTIAVIGALEEQIESIKEHIEIISAKNIVGLDFIMGKMLGNNIVLVRAGVGKVNASICTQILIDMYAVDIVINVGIAEGISGDVILDDIVISDDVCYFDFDTSFFGTPKGVIYRMDESFFKADPELIALSLKAIEESGKAVHIGRIASGDKIITNLDEKNEIRNEFKALCINMESGAIAHTCELNMVPFVVICLIYDKLSENEADIFSGNSINSLSDILVKIIDMIE